MRREPRSSDSSRSARFRCFLRDNSLGLAFLAGFLITLVGPAVAGHADFNNQLASEGWRP